MRTNSVSHEREVYETSVTKEKGATVLLAAITSITSRRI